MQHGAGLNEIALAFVNTTSRSNFGKMNSTLGSVVPLAMFLIETRVPIQDTFVHDERKVVLTMPWSFGSHEKYVQFCLPPSSSLVSSGWRSSSSSSQNQSNQSDFPPETSIKSVPSTCKIGRKAKSPHKHFSIIISSHGWYLHFWRAIQGKNT